MKLIEQTLINQYDIAREIDDALLRIAQETFAASHGSPHEPDFIASLVTDFTPELYEILEAYYSGITFGITSIYAHQKPTVNIGTPKNPELGDLLFVLMHTDSNNRKWLNSLLFQAKMTIHEISRVPPSDHHQLQLYMDWPKFKYVNSSPRLKGKKRNVKPHAVHDGAQYLMIDKNPSSASGRVPEFPMGCAVPDKTLVLDRPLNYELVNFLKFKSGRTFEERHRITEDWSKIIWDLIDLSATLYSKRKNSGRDSFSRQYQSGNMELDAFSKYDIPTSEEKITDNEEFAVPIIRIESAEIPG